jgi:hypothetical protein
MWKLFRDKYYQAKQHIINWTLNNFLSIKYVAIISNSVIAGVLIYIRLFNSQILGDQLFIEIFILLIIANAILSLLQNLPIDIGVKFTSFTEIMREIRQAIFIHPMEKWTEWSHTDWEGSFKKLANLIERQVDGLLNYSDWEGVACNLFISLPSTETMERMRRIPALHGKVLNEPYSLEDEGINHLNIVAELETYLIMVGRGIRSEHRDYPWIILRVPKDQRKALPGAPDAYHKLLQNRRIDMRPPFSYIENITDERKMVFNGRVTFDGKQAVIGYFKRYEQYIQSFISLGLIWHGEPIGILNIDSRYHSFLSNKNRDILLDLLMPYIELMARFAYIYKAMYNSWINGE